MSTELRGALRERSKAPGLAADEVAALDKVASAIAFGEAMVAENAGDFEQELHQALAEEDKLLAWVETRKGHYSKGEKGLAFDSDEDQQRFDAAAMHIRQIATQAEQRRQKILRDIQNSP